MIIGFEHYRKAFYDIWLECMKAGYTTVDARHFAALELADWNTNAAKKAKA